MTDKNDLATCQRNCWLIGGGIGLVLAYILAVSTTLGFLWSLLFGIVAAVIAALVLRSVMCGGAKATPGSAPATEGSAAAHAGVTPGAAAAEALPVTSENTESVTPSELKDEVPEGKPVPEVATVPPGSEAEETAETEAVTPSEMKDEVPEGKPAPEVATVPPGSEAEETAEAEAVTPSEMKDNLPADESEPEVATLPTGAVAEPKSGEAESKPTLYDAVPVEGADDLKLISGVGPKMEQTLNELGIYKFEQVAAWGPSEVAWVDQRLRFKGRIERDDWIGQARTLADGGETEFSARKKKS